MKRTVCLVFLLFFVSMGPAFADYYNFSYVDGSFTVSGTLFATTEDGLLTITGGSLGDAMLLYTGSGAAPAGERLTSPAGAFWYDNKLSLGSTPALNNWGLLFTEGSAGTPGYKEINIWGNNGAHDYSYDEWTGGSYVNAFNNGTFTVTQGSSVPVPPAALLLGSGLFGLVVARKRLKK